MKDFSYLPKGEIAVDNAQAMESLVEILLENEYVVMVSREENLYIINYTYSQHSNRNNVVFQSREIFEDFLYNFNEEEEENESR